MDWMISRADLDANSSVPLYRQIFDHFASSIGSGSLSNGTRLPATRELAGQLGLNRTTVAAAYEMLETQGLISGHVGRGSFVCGGASAPDWGTLLGPTSVRSPAASTAGISFATSRPAEELFPLGEFRDTCREVSESGHLATLLQLGSPSGYEPLRRYLQAEAGATSAELLVTSGCQQALDLIARALLRPGDKVAVEDPVYPGLKNLFLRAGARLLGVPVGAAGIDLEALERVLATERPRLLAVTSNFQNPTGATLPLEARQAILRMAREHGAVLVENDIYGELRYSGEALPSIRQIDDTGNTILLRSFSKVAFPGLRVGWVVGPPPLIARLVELKHLTDLHTDQLSQAVLLRFAESGRLARHQRSIVEAGGVRLAAALEACREWLPRGTHFTHPSGGMNLWVRLPAPLDAGELLARAQQENVTYLPGGYFTVSHEQPGGLRLSFAGLQPAAIRQGIQILGGVFSRELERSQTMGQGPALAMV